MKRVLVSVVSGVILAVGTEYSAQTPTGTKFRKHAGKRILNQYIVVLRSGVASQADLPGLADQLSRRHGGTRRHVYTHALEGFSVRLPEPAARRLSEDPRVAYVEEDGVTSGTAVQSAPRNWGLDRVDQRGQTPNSAYRYFADGTGVNVYVVDTGILASHTAFEGRVVGAYSAVNDGVPPDLDCNGHGTHVAGIVGSNGYGVAKKATLHSVRALGCGDLGPGATTSRRLTGSSPTT